MTDKSELDITPYGWIVCFGPDRFYYHGSAPPNLRNGEKYRKPDEVFPVYRERSRDFIAS